MGRANLKEKGVVVVDMQNPSLEAYLQAQHLV
jgi:hypothetical protein